MILLLSSAFAGFYHPADVASESRLFRAASKEGSAAAEAQRQARVLALALQDYEEAVDVLGEVAHLDDRARIATLTTHYNRQFAVLQAHADDVVLTFDNAFKGALKRALAGESDAYVCEREVPSGPRLPGLSIGLTVANPACRGDDLNRALATRMDADPTLAADLKVLSAKAWPVFDLPPVPMAVGGDHVQATAVFHAFLREELIRLRRVDEDDRLEIEAAIEQGATQADLEALKPQAAAIDARTARRRLDLTAAALGRAQSVLAKQGAWSWCAQPAVLGGCTGNDRSPEAIELLAADRKFSKLVR